MNMNAQLAERFGRMAKMMELLGEDSFRVLAHAKAARVLEDYAADVGALARGGGVEARKRLTAIEGVGPKIADKIIEFVETGKIKELEALTERVPAGLVGLLEISGLGPKTVATLWHDGGVTDLAGLKAIIADGRILGLPRMGEKSVKKIKEAIAIAEQGAGRLHLGRAANMADVIVARLKGVAGVQQVEAAGSLRRGKETVGDLDVLVSSTDAAAVSAAFVGQPEVRQVLVHGDTKSSVRMSVIKSGVRGEEWGSEGAGSEERTIQVDLRVIDASSFGAALMYFTGSKEHNVKMRERAQQMGYTLNEYGLFEEDDAGNEKEPPQKRGKKPIVGKTEAEVYAKLKMREVPAHLRENRGEMDVFETGYAGERAAVVTELLELSDIRAELHAHTTASDGVMSIVELATEAKRRGFHTIAVTDHSKSSVIANGLSPERLRAHIQSVRAAQAEVDGITILAGSEVDILSDGRLDYDDDLLAELDVVVASPHVALGQEPSVATARLLKAVRHPLVHILGHPTGRLIDMRAGLSPDMAELVSACKEHDVALEINAHWLRLDLRDTQVRLAMDIGAKIAIDCDVHQPRDFDNLRFGVATARRGWATKGACVNAWEAKKLHAWLKAKR